MKYFYISTYLHMAQTEMARKDRSTCQATPPVVLRTGRFPRRVLSPCSSSPTPLPRRVLRRLVRRVSFPGAPDSCRLVSQPQPFVPGTTADGMFSLLEVECLGACANAPMVQVSCWLVFYPRARGGYVFRVGGRGRRVCGLGGFVFPAGPLACSFWFVDWLAPGWLASSLVPEKAFPGRRSGRAPAHHRFKV